MPFVVAVVAGLVFGAADQYLGSRSITLGHWASTAAQVSAPWLILPFVMGTLERRPRRAMVLGLVATASALTGYFVMTYSPIEVPGWTFQRFVSGLVAVSTSGYNPLYIVGGLVTGPLFGLLGQRWRVRRWWVSAAVVGGALCLEPLARWITGQLSPPAPVWAVEVMAGVALTAALAYIVVARSPSTSTLTSRPTGEPDR